MLFHFRCFTHISFSAVGVWCIRPTIFSWTPRPVSARVVPTISATHRTRAVNFVYWFIGHRFHHFTLFTSYHLFSLPHLSLGAYQFNATLLGRAHEWNQQRSVAFAYFLERISLPPWTHHHVSFLPVSDGEEPSAAHFRHLVIVQLDCLSFCVV